MTRCRTYRLEGPTAKARRLARRALSRAGHTIDVQHGVIIVVLSRVADLPSARRTVSEHGCRLLDRATAQGLALPTRTTKARQDARRWIDDDGRRLSCEPGADIDIHRGGKRPMPKAPKGEPKRKVRRGTIDGGMPRADVPVDPYELDRPVTGAYRPAPTVDRPTETQSARLSRIARETTARACDAARTLQAALDAPEKAKAAYDARMARIAREEAARDRDGIARAVARVAYIEGRGMAQGATKDRQHWETIRKA